MNRRDLLAYVVRCLENLDDMVDAGDESELIQHVIRSTRGFIRHHQHVEAEARSIELEGRVRRREPHPAVRAFVIRRDNSECAICGQPVRKWDVHIDHHVPVARGGTEDPDNLRVTHSWCNLEKGARLQ
jgi:5-methylcytosine-specific restriction protein A